MNPIRKTILGVAIVGSTIAGGAMGAAMMNTAASAADDTTTTAVAPDSAPTDGTFDPAMGGHVGSNGAKEELLTGDTAEKVKAAALAANPGATIERVETDVEGDTYEAHIVKADGTRATVKPGADFKVTKTEAGMH